MDLKFSKIIDYNGLKSITWSKYAMIIDYIDNILVNENPLKSCITHETSVRVGSQHYE